MLGKNIFIHICIYIYILIIIIIIKRRRKNCWEGSLFPDTPTCQWELCDGSKLVKDGNVKRQAGEGDKMQRTGCEGISGKLAVQSPRLFITRDVAPAESACFARDHHANLNSELEPLLEIPDQRKLSRTAPQTHSQNQPSADWHKAAQAAPV